MRERDESAEAEAELEAEADVEEDRDEREEDCVHAALLEVRADDRADFVDRRRLELGLREPRLEELRDMRADVLVLDLGALLGLSRLAGFDEERRIADALLVLDDRRVVEVVERRADVLDLGLRVLLEVVDYRGAASEVHGEH